MMTQREMEYKEALDREYLKMFPWRSVRYPVCSYDCVHCRRHVGWVEFMDGVIPKNYRCDKCNQPVQLVFSHEQQHINHRTKVGDTWERFRASDRYAAFLSRHGTLSRIEPDIEDEP